MPANAAVTAVNLFERRGDDWAVTFEKHALRVRDSKGLRYLAQLVDNPGVDLHVGRLIELDGRHAAEVPFALETSARPAACFDTGPVIDSRAQREYSSRLKEIPSEAVAAGSVGDYATAARLEAEKEFLARELYKAIGRRGRVRKTGDRTERMRKAVTNRLREAVRRLDDQDSSLGSHLLASLRLGVFCSYVPVSSIAWLVNDRRTPLRRVA